MVVCVKVTINQIQYAPGEYWNTVTQFYDSNLKK